MLIAKVENDQVLEVADYRAMFPNTSFSANGIHDSFYAENGLMPVSVFKPYDQATEELVSCSPYIEDGQVFTMAIIPKTIQIIENTVSDMNFASSVDGAF